MEKIIKLMGNIENNILLKSVRRGMMIMVPIVLVASIAQAVIAFPITAVRNWIADVCGGSIYFILTSIKDFSFSYFSIILAISTSVSYAMEKKEHMESLVLAPILSCASFLLMIHTDASGGGLVLGAQSGFMALIVSLAVSAFYIFLINSPVSRIWGNIGGDDVIYAGVMKAVVPSCIVMLAAALWSFLFKEIFGINDIISWMSLNVDIMMGKLKSGFLTAVVSAFLIHILWFFGIHGNNIFDNFMQLHSGVGENIIFSKTFFDAFVNMGGCGTSMCIILAILFFAKQKRTKNLAKTAVVPIMFNINEILTFGLPIIWNPAMLIPFILVPIECAVIAYTAIRLGIVAPVTTNVEWTVPVFASGYIATGGSVSGSILQFFNLLIGTLTYIPFIKLYEYLYAHKVRSNVNELTKQLRKAEQSGIKPAFWGSTDTLGAAAHMLADDLKKALMNEEPYLVYQPQFIADGTCVGAEALIRWKHPIAGYIYPPLVIYLAQQGGFLPELEKLIFDRACAAIKEIEGRSRRKFKISVNVTAKSLAWEGLDSYISSCVNKYGIHPEKLWIEITEQDMLSREKDIIDRIENLKKKGHSFLIDDFGMGKTSILYLQTNLFDGIKLDGSLITTILGNKTNKEIVSSIIGLGERLGIKVIAEYVETGEHCDLLNSMGCDWYQGYYFSRPITLDEFIDCLSGKKINTDKEAQLEQI